MFILNILFPCIIYLLLSYKHLVVLSKGIINNIMTYPRVVMVTMVYQNADGMDVNVVSGTFFSQ